ncbi:MAG TPA: MarR family transcriptional regulator [Bryobacteraceae bacterium]|nr:MarR family transcriptional regulator [Bryobacteraceae bacterium]
MTVELGNSEPLPPVAQRFILHWGEMGARWGINRTVAEIHALLYLSPRPMHAEEIARLLSVARSNVSGSLRELQGWGIVRVVHVLGDRRDHFESLKDVWEMFRIIVDERKRREVDPTAAMLRSCVADPGAADEYVRGRLDDMLGFFETMLAIYDEVRRVPPGALRQLAGWKRRLKALTGTREPGRGHRKGRRS